MPLNNPPDRSFLLGDNGSYILVYRGTSWTPDVEIGDVVTVTGTTTVYGGAMQFGDSASYEMTAGNGYTQPTAKEITTQELDAYRTVIVVTPEYIKITGVLTVSGNYYNVAVDGASITGSFTYPVADDVAALQALNGQTVELVGYTTGVTGGGNYLSIMVTEFCEASQN